MPVFKTGALNRSATLPSKQYQRVTDYPHRNSLATSRLFGPSSHQFLGAARAVTLLFRSCDGTKAALFFRLFCLFVRRPAMNRWTRRIQSCGGQGYVQFLGERLARAVHTDLPEIRVRWALQITHRRGSLSHGRVLASTRDERLELPLTCGEFSKSRYL